MRIINLEQNIYFRDPIHSLCVGALLAFRKDAEVFVSVCEAIFWLAADNGNYLTQLGG